MGLSALDGNWVVRTMTAGAPCPLRIKELEYFGMEPTPCVLEAAVPRIREDPGKCPLWESCEKYIEELYEDACECSVCEEFTE